MSRAHQPRSRAFFARGQHACWGYNDEEMFRRRVDEFIAEGLDSGYRVVTLAAASPGTLPRPGGRPSQVTEVAVEDFYRTASDRAVLEWRTAFIQMAEKARDDGFEGVGVITDITRIVGDRTRDEILRWELTLGVLVQEYPMTVLCAIQPSEVDKDVAADLASLHTVVDGSVPAPLASFRLTPDTVLAKGELDSTNTHLLELALAEATDDITIDLSGVHFIDLRSIDRLRNFVAEAQERGSSVTLTGVPAIVERCWSLLGGT